MPQPSIEQFAAITADLDIELLPARLAQAHQTHAAMRGDVERIRRLPLPFLDPVDEPAHALAFIRSGDTR